MNILEIEDIIKGLPDQALMQEAQAPSGQMPQFLVVSEIQRRADMRKRFQNQQQEMPQGTIAQQIVQGGIASMGNQQPIQPMPPQGMPPQGMPPMPPQGMPMQQQPPMMPPMSPPMSPPMMPPAQGMAAGGVVRMQGGTQTPYTGGTGASYIYRDSIVNPERFSRMMEMNFPNYSLVSSGFGFNPQENLLNRNENVPAQQARSPSIGSSVLKDKLAEGLTKEETALEKFHKMGDENRIKNERIKQQTSSSSIFQGTGPINLFEDNTGLPPYNFMATPPIDKSTYDSMTSDLLSNSFAPYLNAGNAVTVDADRYPEVSKNQSPDQINETLEPALNTNDPKKTDERDKKKDPDYSSLMAALDQFKPVDYSAFKPDYLNLITEQERRAQKIRADASKDASAQALIQLGAGLAAGDISKGLSAAGQSVADIKRQARAEARDEEGFARQLRLAQDEAGMQIGIKGAEAEREMARFKATYGVSLKDLENTMTLAREQIAAEANTEAGRALRGELEGLNNLIKNLMSEQYAGDIEQNKAAIAQAVSRMQFLLGITGEKQDKEKDPLGIGV